MSTHLYSAARRKLMEAIAAKEQATHLTGNKRLVNSYEIEYTLPDGTRRTRWSLPDHTEEDALQRITLDAERDWREWFNVCLSEAEWRRVALDLDGSADAEEQATGAILSTYFARFASGSCPAGRTEGLDLGPDEINHIRRVAARLGMKVMSC